MKLEEDLVEKPHDFSCMIKLLANKINKINWQHSTVEVAPAPIYFQLLSYLIDAREKSPQVRHVQRQDRGHQSTEGAHPALRIA